MAFDWKAFLSDRQIHFVTRGPNVAYDHVAIKCPFCGEDDPSEHMGLSLSTGAWGCWRDSSHRGHHPGYLVRRLIRPGESSSSIVAEYGGVADLSRGDSAVEELKKQRRGKSFSTLSLPENFKPLKQIGGWATSAYRPFLQYLRKRGFEIKTLVERYEIYACLTGEWAGRLIFPFREDGELMTWQGRSINNVDIRYKALSRDGDLKRSTAIKRPTDLLWNFDSLRKTGGGKLLLVEGVFDALKLDIAGLEKGVRATSLSTRSISQEQSSLIVQLFMEWKLFDELILVPDKDRVWEGGWLCSELAGMDHRTAKLPDGVKDAGELSMDEARKFIMGLI